MLFMKIAMCADLHLCSAEADWSLALLEEIVRKAERETTLLVIGGDLFDSLDDASALRDAYARIVERSGLAKVIWTAGNHDVKNPSGKRALARLEDLSFGEKTKLVLPRAEGNPLFLFTLPDLEIAVLPFMENPRWYEYSQIEPKKTKRILVAHGMHADCAIAPEEENCLFPKNFERLFDADYMLLGHIHKHVMTCAYCYPGSARVWRRGETGEHGFVVFDTSTNSAQFRVLEQGGFGYELELFVSGSLPEISLPDKERLVVDCTLSGVVDNDAARKTCLQKTKECLETRAFRFSIDEKQLYTIESLMKLPAWETFNRELERRMAEAPEQKENFELARRIFLEKLIASRQF